MTIMGVSGLRLMSSRVEVQQAGCRCQWLDTCCCQGTMVTQTPGLSHQYNMHTHVFSLNGLNTTKIESRCDCEVKMQDTQHVCRYGFNSCTVGITLI